MTQPDQTTPTAPSWTVFVCALEGCDAYAFDQEVQGGLDCGPNCCNEATEVEVIPLSTLSRLVEELESRARTTLARYGVAASGHDRGRQKALREAASLISQSLPTTQEDE